MLKFCRYITFLACLLFSFNMNAQKHLAGAGLHEFGAGIGALNYTGELAPRFNLSFYRPAGILFYRYNISPVVSFRFSGLGGLIQANESNNQDPVNAARSESFSTSLGELAAAFEYNFFNYRPKKELYRYSPYLTFGFAFFVVENGGGNLGIPMGVGFKYRLNKRLNLGIEFVARKTFTDQMDGVSSYYLGTHQTGNRFEKDWYYFTGFTISYTAFSVVCPPAFYE